LAGKGEISLSPTIANPELIFIYDILKAATSNIRADNKLGQGGFGSAFKVSGRRYIQLNQIFRGSSFSIIVEEK
jgi:hypothetical protein